MSSGPSGASGGAGASAGGDDGAPPKRLRLTTIAGEALASLPIHIEPTAGTGVFEMFGDGSYLAAAPGGVGSKAAMSFVSRALGGEVERKEERKEVTEEGKEGTDEKEWIDEVSKGIEGALGELGKAVGVIDALRGEGAPEGAVLQMERYDGRKETEGSGGVGLMGKRRTLKAVVGYLEERSAGMRAKIEADRVYGRAVERVRGMCGGLRRFDAVPAVDVGDGEFVPIEMRADVGGEGEKAAEESCVKVRTRSPLSLSFQIAEVGVAGSSGVCAGSQGEAFEVPDVGETAVVRIIRLSRVNAFRELVFSRLAREAASSDRSIEVTSNAVSLECGPGHLLCARKTLKLMSAPCEALPDNSALSSELLSLIATQACLDITVEGGTTLAGPRILPALETVAVGCCALDALERVLDDSCAFLRLRVDWSRGKVVYHEACARVWASSADGDGPNRLLATFEPINHGNRGGDASMMGHVRIMPAYGVVIAAPDDPSSRSRAGPHGIQSTTSDYNQGTHVNSYLDDVPRAYMCPIRSGEIGSVLTLLLCIRLLDALEEAARAGEASVLDVDRHCFSVVVLAPKTGSTLRMKVWPKGPGPGREAPASSVWLDDERVSNFPSTDNGRLASWRKLLRKIADADKALTSSGEQAAGILAANPPHLEDVLPLTGVADMPSLGPGVPGIPPLEMNGTS